MISQNNREIFVPAHLTWRLVTGVTGSDINEVYKTTAGEVLGKKKRERERELDNSITTCKGCTQFYSVAPVVQAKL